MRAKTFAILMLAGVALTAQATAGDQLARVPLVSDEAAPPAVAEIYKAIRAGGAAPLNMHRAVANAPDPFVAYVNMARSLRRDDHVPRPLRELAILRTLQLEKGDYEIDQHTRMARSCGVTDEQLRALQNWRASTAFSPEQRAVLGWIDGMATTDGPDAASADAMSKAFDPHAVVELTLIGGFYAMSARVTRALDIKPEGSVPSAGGGYGTC